MQVPEGSTLRQDVHHNLRSPQELGMELALSFRVDTHSRHERSRGYIVRAEEELGRRCAGDDDVRPRRGLGWRGGDRRLPAEVAFHLASERARGIRIEVVERHARNLPDERQRPHVAFALKAAADDGQPGRIVPGQVLRGDRGGSRRTQCGDLARIHQHQRRPSVGVAHHQCSLDRRKAVPRRITRKVRVGLGDEIRAIADRKHAGFDVKGALGYMHRCDCWRGSFTSTVKPERPLDGLDAFRHVERFANVGSRQDQRAATGRSQFCHPRDTIGHV